MKSFLKFILFVFIILIGLFIGRNLIAKAAIETGVHLVTGVKLSIADLNIGVGASPSVGIKNLRLHNPDGFQDPVMVDLPEFFVAYQIEPLFQGKVHLPEIRVHLKELVVIKNKSGEVNINKLIPPQAKKKGGPAAEKPKEAGKAPAIQIDKLLLRVEKVVYKDYTARINAPSVKEFKLNLNESYTNIENPAAVVSLIVAKALMNTTIASLTDIDLGALQSSVADTLATSQKVAADAILKGQALIGEQAKAAKELVGSAPESLKKTAGAVGGTAKETAGAVTSTAKDAVKDLAGAAGELKDKLKLPFGKSE